MNQQEAPQSQQPYDPQGVPPSQDPQITNNKTDVMGIVSIVLALTGLSLIGLVVGLIGASQAKKEGRSPVLSRIGWIISLVFTVITSVLIVLLLALPTMQQNLREGARQKDIHSIESQLEEHRNQTGHYPATLEELSGNVSDHNPHEGMPYVYSPLPEGCTQCDSYTLQ